MTISLDLALRYDARVTLLINRLRADFPCPECNGTGQGNDESNPYPEPCATCWGRGYHIEDEED